MKHGDILNIDQQRGNKMFEAQLSYDDGEYKATLTLTVYTDDDGMIALEDLTKVEDLEGNYLDDDHGKVEEHIWDNIQKDWFETYADQLEY